MIMEVQEVIDILTEFKKGKTIQMECDYVDGEGKRYSKWTDIESFESIISNIPFANSMRVKPEPKYRPYKDANEFVDACIKHGNWIKLKTVDTHYIPEGCDPTRVKIMAFESNNTRFVNFDDLLREFTWHNGDPCGVLEEE